MSIRKTFRHTRNNILSALGIIHVLFSLIYQSIVISVFSRDIILQARSDIEAGKNQLHFSRGIHHRIRQYSYFHGYLAYFLSGLISYNIKRKEIELLTYISVCGPLFDDLEDHWNIPNSDILDLVFYNKTISALPEYAAQKSQFYMDQIRSMLPKTNEKLFYQSLHTLIAYQDDNYSQKKGGLASIMFRSTLDKPLEDGERMFIEQLGQLGQRIDDIFDVRMDRKSQNYSWASKLSIEDIEKIYLQEVRSLFKHPYLDGHAIHTANNPLRWELLVLLSPAICALEVFANDPDIMVCDMEKWQNRISCLKHAWFLHKSLISEKL